MKILLTIGLMSFSLSFNLNAEPSHAERHSGHESDKHNKDKEHKEHVTGAKADSHNSERENEHEKEAKHEDHQEENHEEENHEEENPQVGVGKGITEASEEDGIKLSPEATKSFEIVLVKLEDLNNIKLSKKAIVTAGEEVNIFRYRDGFYKRIDFELIKKEKDQVRVRSKDLKTDDQIVVSGMGFLRIAEIAAFGGAPEGHSH